MVWDFHAPWPGLTGPLYQDRKCEIGEQGANNGELQGILSPFLLRMRDDAGTHWQIDLPFRKPAPDRPLLLMPLAGTQRKCMGSKGQFCMCLSYPALVCLGVKRFY